MLQHIYPIYDKLISRKEKEKFLNQRSKVFWFTGLSGSGKSTIALGVEKLLFAKGYLVQVLDGDNIRYGISNNLSFTIQDRSENIRRIAEVSKLFCNSGIICLNTFVSPTVKIRAIAKSIIGIEDFCEIFVDTPIEECEKRDIKGLYKKARAGKIKNFTGIDSPYESPINPFLKIETTKATIEDSVQQCYNRIIKTINPN